MQIGVLGTGTVGRTISSKLVALGHAVKMGSRSEDNPNAVAWAQAAGPLASHGIFSEAAAFGELLFNCTAGSGSLHALASAGDDHLRGKVLIDIANPLDFSRGMPPTLSIANTDSLAEQIQRAFPEVRVVKALNMVNADVMVNPSRVRGGHDALICGNDAAAKAQVTSILRDWFGWSEVIDLGNISGARGMEGYLLLWLSLWSATGTLDFNIKVVR